MRLPRFSISSILALIAIVAVALAASAVRLTSGRMSRFHSRWVLSSSASST